MTGLKEYLNDPENLKVRLQIDFDRAWAEYNSFLDRITKQNENLYKKKTELKFFSFDENDTQGPQKALERMVASLTEMEEKG